MIRKMLAIVAATAVITGVVGIVPALADHGFPYVTIDVAPAGAQVAVGEHFESAEMTNSRPLAAGGVGSLPVFFADDQYGCSYATAAASGRTEWIALARRGQTAAEGTDQCPGFQTKLTTATAAGADALIVINHSPGAEPGTAAGEIPAAMIDKGQGDRLVASLNPSTPDAVKVTLDMLDPDTFLPGHPVAPSKVNSVTATPSGGTLSVSGAATFNGEGPVTLAEDVAGDGPVHPEVSRDHTGVDLTGARAYQPDPTDPTLVFEWKVTNLPAPGSLPEAVRYTIPFKIAHPAGDRTYQLQAKLTNAASITVLDDPQGHAREPGFFQLRGNCVTNYPTPESPLANCPHIAWLTGSFDAATDTVRINLPLGQSYAPDVVPGAFLQPNVVATTTITASYQAVVSNATTSDEALWEEGFEYTVPDRTVLLEVLPATGSNTLRSASASVNQNGSFSGAVDINGLAPGAYRLRSTACFGTNCGSQLTDFTI